MVFECCAAIVLTAAPAQPKLALLNLTGAGVDAKRTEVWGDYFAEQLSRHGLAVTTPSAMQAVLGLERQKQLLGCNTEGSECLAEIVNALGVDGLVTGSVAKGDQGGFVLSLRVLSSRNAEVWASNSARAANEEALLDMLQQSARRFADETYRRLGLSPTATTNPLRAVGWASLGLGSAAAVTAALTFGVAKNNEALLRGQSTTIPDLATAERVASDGRALQTAAGVLTAASAVSVVAGAVLLLTQAGPSTVVLVTPVRGGGAVVLSGVWP